MSDEWPLWKIEHIEYSLPEAWKDVTKQTRYSPQTWEHESGLILCVRGIDIDRVTLSEPYDDPRDRTDLDEKVYSKGSGAAQMRGLINS